MSGAGKFGDLKRRLLFLLGALIVFRIGSYIPVPGIDQAQLAELFKSQRGGILDMFNMFSGGALSRFSIFTLGIMPYISASIIMQLMTYVVPSLEALKKEGESGRRKITQYTRYGTLVLAIFQAGGIAAAVHTTQFEIRKPKHNLLRRVLENIAQEIAQHEQRTSQTIVKVAGICGDTIRAAAEAKLATELGYDAGLLNLADLPRDASDFDLLEHCKEIARIMPIFGFYLNPAVGGRELSFGFWRALAEIPNVVAIKIAAFDRYRTLDVMRAVAEAGRALRPTSAPQQVQAENPIAIYTGNDDHIIGDLLGEWTFDVAGKPVTQRIVGGLLGHWAVWTRCAVETLASIQRVNQGAAVPREALLLDRQVTDMNAAIFDAANHYRGCLPGILEVLRRQGLVESALCLDPDLSLSPGQAEEITRVIKAYPHLTDDAFVAQHRAQWISW